MRSATLLFACATCVSGAELGTQDGIEPAPGSAEMPADMAGDTEMPQDAGFDNMVDAPELPDSPSAGEAEAIMPEEGSDKGVAPAEKKRYTLLFRATGTATYDDNIFFSNEDEESDLIWAFAPGFTLGAGDVLKREDTFLALDYDATAKFFSDHSDLNTVDHIAALAGQWKGAKLTLGGFLNFRDVTDVSSEVGNRIEQKVYEAGGTAEYAVSERFTIGSELSEHVSDYSGGNVDSQETNFRAWIDQDLTALTKLGLGFTAGQIDLSEGPSQTFEQILLRAKYAIDTKLSAQLQAGGELRQVDGGSTKANTVFALGVNYTPYDLLKIGIQGYRRLQPSITDSGAITTVTGVSASISYLFLQRWELACSGAYEHSEYEPVAGSRSANRDDDYLMLRVDQSYLITKTMRVGAFFQYRTNNSSQNERSFDDRQVGIAFSLAF